MPEGGIGAGRHQTDNRRTALCLVPGFGQPGTNPPTVGRIHEDRLAWPILQQTVLSPCQVAPTGGVVRRGAGVEGEVKLAIQPGKKFRCCRPLIGMTGEERIPFHALCFSEPAPAQKVSARRGECRRREADTLKHCASPV